MTFYINGDKREVYVDDYFPFNPATNDWAFSKAVGNELWVLLLEKAWAKIFGSYQRIESGNSTEALIALTGAKVDFIFHEAEKHRQNAIYIKLKKADQLKYAIATAASSSRTGHTSRDMKNVGLVDAHAYSLLEVAEVPHGAGREKLLKIRNPWGFLEWKGAWSDGDEERWTPELKQRMGF